MEQAFSDLVGHCDFRRLTASRYPPYPLICVQIISIVHANLGRATAFRARGDHRSAALAGLVKVSRGGCRPHTGGRHLSILIKNIGEFFTGDLAEPIAESAAYLWPAARLQRSIRRIR